MLRSLVSSALLATALALAPQAGARAQTARDPGAETPPAAATEARFTQTASRLVARDRLTATLRLEVKGADPARVQAQVNERMAGALAKARAAPGIEVETGSYGVNRVFDAKDPDPWRAVQTLVVTSGGFAAVLDLVGALQADGLVLGGLRYFVGEATLKSAQDDLTREALLALKARAGRVAADLGLRLERFQTIDIGNAAEQGGEMAPRFALAQAAASMGAPPATAPGEAVIQVTISASALLAPKP